MSGVSGTIISTESQGLNINKRALPDQQQRFLLLSSSFTCVCIKAPGCHGGSMLVKGTKKWVLSGMLTMLLDTAC